MSTPHLEQVTAALATVNDPEIKRPITDLGMVDSVDIDGSGVVRLTVLLTVAGCPLKDTITIHPMEKYDIEFVANNPGMWLFHCHNLVHMMGGLMTEVRYS